jgi:membrane-bound ClpP family serine protease
VEQVIWSISLLLLGVGLIVLEVFVPSGGALGVLAALSVLAAVVIAFTGGAQLGAAILLATVILVPTVVGLALRWWPHTPMGRMMLIQRPESEEDVLPTSEPYRLRDEMIGKRGRAKTKMLPSGVVVIDGRSYDAISEGMPIEPGEPIQVVAVRTNRIVVRRSDLGQPPAQADDLLSRPIDTVGPDPFEDPLA